MASPTPPAPWAGKPLTQVHGLMYRVWTALQAVCPFAWERLSRVYLAGPAQAYITVLHGKMSEMWVSAVQTHSSSGVLEHVLSVGTRLLGHFSSDSTSETS